MKHFLRKICGVTLAFSLGLLVFVGAVHAMIAGIARFEVPQDKKLLIVGHSHPAYAFNDHLIDNTINLSSAAESYFYTYQKLREVLPKNDIEVVFVEYTNNQISKLMDEWIWGYEKMNQFVPWHSPFMGCDNLGYLFDKNGKDFVRVTSTSTLKNLLRLVTFDYSIGKKFGGYKEMERARTTEELKKEAIENPEITDSIAVSDDNILYLEKIVNYCRQQGKIVYFIRSPQNRYYPRVNEERLLTIKKERFKDVEFLDFDRFPLEAKYFADGGHLNTAGATRFSKWFNGLLKKGLLTQTDKEDFIDQELKKLEATR